MKRPNAKNNPPECRDASVRISKRATLFAVGRMPFLDGGLLAAFDFEMRIFDYSKDISIRVCHRRHDNAPANLSRV